MPALFEQGFFVREPAWHGLGIVLGDYPGRDEAMKLAGHDFRVIERPVAVAGGEYFDHLRAYRSTDSYVKRTLLTDNPAKAALGRTIRDCVAA